MNENKPNVYVSPFVDWMLKGYIKNWLKQPHGLTWIAEGNLNEDYPFDENDSFSWTVKDMKQLLEDLG